VTALLAIAGITAGLVAALALMLPCSACEKRRERLRAALARWRRTSN
jgi:hypothetical protein